MREERANPDAAIARIAARQHGVVTYAQLIAAGLTSSGIDRRIRAGRLHRVYRGVYAVGHAGLSIEGEWVAAVFACGEGAVLSHRSAAQLWRMLEPARGLIDVTIPTASGRRRRKGIRIHRSPSMPIADTTCEDGIAVTTPARTLEDLKRVVNHGLHRRAVRQAEYLRLDLGEITTDRTRSDLERAFLRLCRRHQLPPPQVNAKIGPYTVDFYWPDAGLVVETDAYATHRGRQAFEDDHARDLYLHARGLAVRRFTDSQVYGQPEAVMRAVGKEVARSSRSAGRKRQSAG
jgi:very-short-patch-repair endonuclease